MFVFVAYRAYIGGTSAPQGSMKELELVCVCVCVCVPGGMNTVSTSRPRIVVCPGPTPTLFGCAHEITTAERILRHHFPSVPWLLDEEPPTQPATQTDSTDTGTSTHEGDEEGGEAGGQGGAGQGGANDNKTHDNKHDNTDDTEEDLAIDELEAALGSLLAVTEPSARQSDEAKASE